MNAVTIINTHKGSPTKMHEELVKAGYECKCGRLLACCAKCPKCNPEVK